MVDNKSKLKMIKPLKIEKGKFKSMKQTPLGGAKYLTIIPRVLHDTITKDTCYCLTCPRKTEQQYNNHIFFFSEFSFSLTFFII